jgi:hypothetical protein
MWVALWHKREKRIKPESSDILSVLCGYYSAPPFPPYHHGLKLLKL